MNLRTSLPLLALVLFIASFQAARGNALNFQTLSYGTQSGFQAPASFVIRDNQTYTAAWASLASIYDSPPQPPEVDFSNQMVIAAIMGVEPSCGYAINITSIALTGSSLTVNITRTIPSPGQATCQMTTSPYHLVEVAKTDQPTVFQISTKSADSRQGASSTVPSPAILVILTAGSVSLVLAHASGKRLRRFWSAGFTS